MDTINPACVASTSAVDDWHATHWLSPQASAARQATSGQNGYSHGLIGLIKPVPNDS